MMSSPKILTALLLFVLLLPSLTSANGGDQRLVERGKYFINLSRAPFTPRVGVKTSFVASFFDVGANQLISEDLTVRVRISKLGNAPKGNFIFDQDNIAVKGGVLEFSYTFNEAVLYEIFFDFAFSSNPEKVYNAPDFLIDVQPNQSPEKSGKSLLVASGLEIAIAFLIGLFIGRKIKTAP
ncbi:MAG: hypothetical protein HYS78_00850 [Parcubacteria group bacterium]|nr:hypothetical protein [Parcubacteria group bacterium]